MKKKNKVLWIEVIVLIFCFFLLFFLYGPFSFFREFFITSSMTTFSHQYLARMFYTSEEIDQVMRRNKVIEKNMVTSLSKIHVKKRRKLYSIRKIYGPLYQGYLVEIYDPFRIHLVTSFHMGTEGEDALTVAGRHHAKILINSVGFLDPDFTSNGAVPHGTVIQNGKVISQYGTSNVGGGFVGFTSSGKLFLGDVSVDEALAIGVKDAVEFGPFLIVNGKKSSIEGNGGFGIAPRTAIGQRRDGTVLFLVINGRIPSSVGASMKDLIDIMEKNGAYNAVNMDGGSSSCLIENSKVINRPVGGGKNGLRKLPVFWMVK